MAYLAVLALVAGGAYLCIRAAGGERAAVVVAAVLLLVPGRLQGLLLRPLFRGRRDLARGEPDAAARQFESLLDLLARQPWRRWALWLGWSAYTPSAQAMGLNNLGAARADAGDAARAREAWDAALVIDPLYPLPYANLATLVAADGDAERAAALLARAAQLGYSGGALDRATQRVQTLLAAFESRGPTV